MPEDNPLGERGRALEDDYYRRRDRELIEKMQRAAAADASRRELGAKSGLQDPELLQELQALGFTPDTVVLLPILPLLQVGWAEGGISDAERKLILQFARARGVAEGGAADAQLAEWLTTRPDADVFARAARLIRAMLDAPVAHATELTADDLVKQAESIAAASGGILGINRVSAEERTLLASLARDLTSR